MCLKASTWIWRLPWSFVHRKGSVCVCGIWSGLWPWPECKPWREAPPFPLLEKGCDIIMHTLWERINWEIHYSCVTFLASWKKKDDQDSAFFQAKIVCIASGVAHCLHHWVYLLSVLLSWNKRRYPAVERPQKQADDAFNKKIMFINWILVTKECGDAEPCPTVCLLLKSCEYITLRLGKLRGVKTSKSFSSSTLQWHFCQLQRTMQIWTIMNIVLILLSVAWGSFESTCWYTGKFISTHPDCMVLKSKLREFPVLGTLCSHCQGPGFNPWLGN